MPFDVVWIDNFYKMDVLTLKNLIGRSGRTTGTKFFDFGYTVLHKKNVRTFSERFRDSFEISAYSELDADVTQVDEDYRDDVEALRNNEFNDDHHLTESQYERLVKASLGDEIAFILNHLLKDGRPITGNDYQALGKQRKQRFKDAFKRIFVEHLRRKELEPAETTVLSTSIPIMLWHIQGRSFSEIVSLRHAYLSQKDERRSIMRRIRNGELSATEATAKIEELTAKFSQVPFPLPRKKEKKLSIFPTGTSVTEIDYDTIVFDTYDYLDKIISLSLVDPICAALDIFYDEYGDERALALKNFVRYGTDDQTEIWLLRYGFGFEEIEWLRPHIAKIDEQEIVFRKTVSTLSEDQKKAIYRYR